ncbi:MAG: hypothetical protein ACRD3O_00335 [Terriglobia bacterium]
MKAALHRRARGAGPPTRYQCASHHNGGNAACSVSLSAPRERIEQVILACIEGNLLDVKRLTELEQRYADAHRRAALAVDAGPRLLQLDQEIRNITDAIAQGLVSDALAERLTAAEAERARDCWVCNRSPSASLAGSQRPRSSGASR